MIQDPGHIETLRAQKWTDGAQRRSHRRRRQYEQCRMHVYTPLLRTRFALIRARFALGSR
eukprot:1879939-Prymnesium_polylepis.2